MLICYITYWIIDYDSSISPKRIVKGVRVIKPTVKGKKKIRKYVKK